MIVKYQALNKSGTVVADTIMADDLPQARAELSRQGLMPIHIKENAESSNDNFSLNVFMRRYFKKTTNVGAQRASKSDLPFFTSQMAILLETGTPVAVSLSAI